jgi:hypothetical protein
MRATREYVIRLPLDSPTAAAADPEEAARAMLRPFVGRCRDGMKIMRITRIRRTGPITSTGSSSAPARWTMVVEFEAEVLVLGAGRSLLFRAAGRVGDDFATSTLTFTNESCDATLDDDDSAAFYKPGQLVPLTLQRDVIAANGDPGFDAIARPWLLAEAQGGMFVAAAPPLNDTDRARVAASAAALRDRAAEIAAAGGWPAVRRALGGASRRPPDAQDYEKIEALVGKAKGVTQIAPALGHAAARAGPAPAELPPGVAVIPLAAALMWALTRAGDYLEMAEELLASHADLINADEQAAVWAVAKRAPGRGKAV